MERPCRRALVLSAAAISLIVTSACSHPKSECDDDADCPPGQNCISVLERPPAPSFQVDDDHLHAPASSTSESPSDTVTVAASATSLSVDDTEVMPLPEHFPIEDGDDNPRRIAPLYDSLIGVRRKQEKKAALLDEPHDPKMTLVADRTLPTTLIQNIISTARRAGYDDIRLATQRVSRQEVWRD